MNAPNLSRLSLPSPIVCLGASAGGLRALEAFFHAMPANSGCGFVVVQHLSPDFKSLMDDLLSRQTTMPVVPIEDGMLLGAGRVHLIPPKKLVTIKDGAFILTDRDTDRGGPLPIDVFLRSLAAEAGPRAICAILSGTGSDGAAGVRAIHEAGGLVIVQNPESAEFDGMPKSALATGLADYVLPPERMPEAVAAFLGDPAARPHLAPARPQDDEAAEFADIFRRLRDAFGLDFAHYKLATVERRIHRRMTLTGLDTVPAYVGHLSLQSAELDALYHDLLIGVTEFFRDPQVFETLAEQVYRPLLVARPRDELRVWIAGCATGEEAYSHAILLDELARETSYSGRVSIFATDVHRTSIETAANGLYPRAHLARLSPERISRYFKDEKNELMRIVPEIRQRIVFAPHNLLSDAPFTKLDAISCRNLLIYLTPEAQERVISTFHYALLRHGGLLLGPSESLGRFEPEFETLDTKAKIFRKLGESRLPLELRPAGIAPRARRPAPSAALATPPPPALPKILVQAYDQLLSEYAPPGLIVDETADILHFVGDGARHLSAQSGRASNRLLDRCEGDLRLALSTLMPKVVRSRQAARAHDVRVPSGSGGGTLLDVTVKPLCDDRPGQILLHIIFAEARRASAVHPADDLGTDAATLSFVSSEAQSGRIADLEIELQNARENLQNVVEELQTANEELQASNEELLASNEELQSTNEELHSVNEELYTVNAEFDRKNTELKLLNADLDNLFNATRDAALFLDRSLRIRKFNTNIGRFFHLMPQDIGRPIAHIAYELDGQGDMLGELEVVLETGRMIENEVRTRDGHWLLKRIHPFLSARRAIEGVVLTFTEIDHQKEMQDKLDLAMASSRLVWWEWDLPTKRLSTHASGWCILGYATDCMGPDSDTWFNLTHPDDLPRVRASLEDCLQDRSANWDCEHRFKDSTGGWRWVLNKGRVTKRDKAGRPLRMLGTTQDVHDRHTAETEVLKLHHAIEQTAVSIVITDASGTIEYVNPFFTRITGYSEGEVLGQNPRLLKSEFTPPQVHAELWETITRGEIWRGELTNRRKDGTFFLERVTIAPVKDHNAQITHYISVNEDITALRAEEERHAHLEQQLARANKMETLGTLAGGIAHDFNNLLTSILGYTEIAGQNLPALGPDHPARSSLDHVLQAGNRAADLVRRILAFSRNHPVARQSLRLDRLVAESLPILRPSLPATLDLVFDDTSQGATVLGDPAQLQQVVMNLCTNSAHAIGGAKGRITIALRRIDITNPFPVEGGALSAGPYLLLQVCDTGPGVPREMIHHIFEPFFTTKEAGRGTGLGLSIVLATVLNHNGAIAVESQLGAGCAFSVYLPRELAPDPIHETAPSTARPTAGKGERIAIVDDDQSIANLSHMALGQTGYDGRVLPDAESCLEVLRADPQAFSLVLTDQTMPGMTGIELLRELRALAIPVPVIISSGYAKLVEPAELEQLGNCAFLAKPFELEQLLGSVRQFIPQPAGPDDAGGQAERP